MKSFLGPVLGLLFCLFIVVHPVAAKEALSDDQIKQILIQQSLSSYPGNCPCPYNSDRAGRSCGRRSAYSRPGGYEPLCYPSDVTPQMIEAYRKENNVPAPPKAGDAQ